jgi:hypothetical protein
MANADQKSSVRNPQNATLTSSTDHSEGFSQNSLPSLTAYAIIAGTRCWTSRWSGWAVELIGPFS